MTANSFCFILCRQRGLQLLSKGYIIALFDLGYYFADERPDLPHIQYIKYRSESGEKEYRAIDDIATELEAVALQLGIKQTKIKNIATAKPDPVKCASEVLGLWLNSDTEATWARLIAAMRTTENLNFAAKKLETALLNMIPN